LNDYGGILRVLNFGDGFGEKALIENRLRALTAVVKNRNY
jgi:hypothetical protein